MVGPQFPLVTALEDVRWPRERGGGADAANAIRGADNTSEPIGTKRSVIVLVYKARAANVCS